MPPLYNYRCKDCGAEYEVFYTSQSKVLLEEKHEACTNCKSKKKKKLPAKGTSFQLKGRGWYRDGY